MVLADLEGRITYANQAFVKLWGYDREEEVVGRMNTELATSADQVQQIMEATRTSGGWAGESIAKKKDGTPLDIQLSVTMVADSDNTPLCTMASFLDIGDRKRVEQSERMAEVGKLASGLVHEVRNPLNAMRMQIAVIRNKLKDPHHENMSMAITQLGRLEHEVLRVQHLANDFLAYGRPASDNPQAIELHWLLSDIAEFVKPEFEQIGVHVDVTKGADSAELAVCMDLSKLRQALLNLIENARQAMVNGGELRLRCDKPANQEARIRVCDTGCGISQERLPRIFEVFYSTRDEGAGLGLAIVKRTVEAAGGRIAVESEIDRGTCFEIYLPLVTENSSRPS
jgi:PAS domain S-box-containing protein